MIAVGEGVTNVKPGDRCAVEPYISCGQCHACRLGRTNCCESLKVLGVHCEGGMRPFISVPVELLHKSDKLSLDQLALVETLGIGAHAVGTPLGDFYANVASGYGGAIKATLDDVKGALEDGTAPD